MGCPHPVYLRLRVLAVLHSAMTAGFNKVYPCMSVPKGMNAVHEPSLRYLLVVRSPREGLQYLVLLRRLVQLAGQHALHSATSDSSTTRAEVQALALAVPGWLESASQTAHQSAHGGHATRVQRPQEWYWCAASMYRCLVIAAA